MALSHLPVYALPGRCFMRPVLVYAGGGGGGCGDGVFWPILLKVGVGLLFTSGERGGECRVLYF